MEWVTENWPVAAALMAVALPTFVQIMPIKINPWSAIATAIGRALNKELIEKVEHLQSSLDKHIVIDNERAVDQCRRRILRFNDEVIQGKKHTREHFNEILGDITYYERYCVEHPLYKNDKANLSIENIRRTYRQCELEKTFL